MERNILHYSNNPNLCGFSRIIENIHYAAQEDNARIMTLLLPWSQLDARKIERPLIVFVQGSAWTTPDFGYELPQLSVLSRAGYVVATVCHRSALNGFASPAYLQDVKQAIRYLRANASTYGIDTGRVAIFGTSSGGNTALLVGLTGNRPEFKTEEYADQSDAVSAVVDCFGPTDLFTMLPKEAIQALENKTVSDKDDFGPIFMGLIGNRNLHEVFNEMSPVQYVDSCSSIPPMYLLHGNSDPVVPYSQSIEMYDKLAAAGACVQMACVENAPHEDHFWSEPLLQSILAFLNEKLNWKPEI